jgi:putative acetyltransferase
VGSTFRIRQATVGDAHRLHELHTRSVTELCREYYTAEQMAGWLRHRTPDGYLPDLARGEMFVAVEGAQIVGFGHAVSGEILAVYVDPERAGQGVGTRLLAHGIKTARQRHHEAIRVDATLNRK